MPQPTDPYLRPAPPEGTPSPTCPQGWVAEPIGRWDGQFREVVYQPRRHDILIVRGPPSPKVEGALPGTGWAQAHATDGARMWVRDRLALTRDALDRLQHRPAPARTLQRGL
jgi:hypothetical protein